MKTFELIRVSHDFKKGASPKSISPNINESTVFTLDGKVAGFYLKDLGERARKILRVANAEFLSDNVPKQVMNRATPKGEDESGKFVYSYIKQKCTILGALPPKPHMRRDYRAHAQVHGVKSAQQFIKAMLMLSNQSSRFIGELMPDQLEAQRSTIEKSVDEKNRFGDLFTSSISNFNISAPYHTDKANLLGTVNAIYTMRKNASGGCLHVPDYNICIEQASESLLVYPAFANMHGVTPIKRSHKDGYRNTFIFYALKKLKEKPSEGVEA